MSRSETAKRWQERLRRFDRSQMTVAQFCRNEGVSQPSFYQWRKKLRQPTIASHPEPTDSTVQVMPLRLSARSGNRTDEPIEQAARSLASTTIELPGGVRIRVEVPTDRQTGQQVEART